MKPTLLSSASEQARVAQLFNHVRDGVIMVDPASLIGFWSDGAAAIYSRPAAEALIQRYVDVIPASCRQVQMPLIERALRGESSHAEWQTISTDAQPMWLEGDFRPVHDPAGQCIGCSILLHNVTRWRAAERAQAESEARYRLLAENATDLIARLNPHGFFLYVSSACRSLFGMEPAEFIGRHLSDVLHEADGPRISEFLNRLAEGTHESTYVHQCRHSDGSYVWCESTVRAVLDPAGRVTEIVAVMRSIEERRKLEAKARNSQQLQAVGRLAGGVAHDFNNLLTVINGFSEMVLRGLNHPDPVRIGAQVQEIRKAGERASVLTRQLLAFGRQQAQNRKRVQLNNVIDEALKLIGRVLGEDVEIETRFCSELYDVHADVGQIEQVLMNLAVNAREAMPEGGVLTLTTANVTFESAPEDDVRPGEYVMIAVSDNGVGMDESTRARAFEPFFTTKELGKGTGLGLAMVHGVVKQNEGHIAVESEPGQGTTFRVYLPRLDGSVEPSGRRPSSIVRSGRESILLVEDDDSVRSATASLLRSLGYRVIEACGPQDALRRCREHAGPIHLLLTDVVMPLMSGREVAERINEMVPGIKTLYMSGYTDDSIVRHGVLDDGVAFINKPLSHEALGRKLREVLGPSRAAIVSSVI